MRVPLVALTSAAVILLGASKTVAQERGQLGLTMGYPTEIGVVWHVADRVGLKGAVDFGFGSSEFDASVLLPERESHTDSFGVGVAGLLYFNRKDNVSTYFSPRFAYARTTTAFEGQSGIILPGISSTPSLEIRSESSSYSFAGSFGAQYSPNRRFSVFGELGLNYSSGTIESSASLSLAESETSTFGVRSPWASSCTSTESRGPRGVRSRC